VNVTEFLDALNAEVDNLGTADASNTARRARNLRFTKRAFGYVYLYRDWPCRKASATIVVPAGVGYVVVPSTYLTIAYKGGVYNTATGKRLTYADPQVITNLRERVSPVTTDDPDVYSIFGMDGTTKRPLFQIPTNVSDLTFKQWLDSEVPTLDESTNVANLKIIPERYHETVLFPAVAAMIQSKKHDPTVRTFLQDPDFQAGLQQMVITELPGKERFRQLPGFFGDCGD
jgi:hypothetical protein